MNFRPHGPEPCALPTALHPDLIMMLSLLCVSHSSYVGSAARISRHSGRYALRLRGPNGAFAENSKFTCCFLKALVRIPPSRTDFPQLAEKEGFALVPLNATLIVTFPAFRATSVQSLKTANSLAVFLTLSFGSLRQERTFLRWRRRRDSNPRYASHVLLP